MVATISDAAVKLGVTAQTAFVWWIIVKLATQIIWGTVASITLWRATNLLGQFGNGLRLNNAVKAACGYNYPDKDQYIRAEHAILSAFKAPPR